MPDLLNPVRPESPYDSQFPVDMQQDAQSLRRRRALVDLLLARSLQPPAAPTSGGITLPISPLAALSNVASMGTAALAQKGLDRGEGDLAKRYSEGLSDAQFNVGEMIKNKDYSGAAQIAGRYPAMKGITEKLLERQFPQNVLHTTYGPGGAEQVSGVNMNDLTAPPVPIGGVKTPPLHPVETADAGGQPQTSFVNLQDPNLQPLPKPAALHAAGLGGTTELYNPYGQPRTLIHTIDPNRVPLPEDMPGIVKAIGEYRQPGYTAGNSARSPGASAIMGAVYRTYPNYDASVFPVVKQAEVEFNQKNAPQVRQFGTFVGHVKAIKDLYTALDNPTDITRINQARNFFQEEFGYPAPAAIDTARPFLAGEAVKAVTGGPGAVEDRKAIADRFSKAQSPAAFNAAADTALQFGAEQLKGHLQQLKGMTKGKRGEADFAQYLTPGAQEVFQKYGGSLTPSRRASDQPGAGGLPSPDAIDAELRRRQGG